ncbi:MAG: D-amino acid dehydrogenase [Rhodospirillaceae bacterium]|nr:D-amino acid dehydrogenase [Rhodospirillaceae bacterium]MBL6930597.1 D-amino acid dehydrogenase [Rhodospirillales bacterium]
MTTLVLGAGVIGVTSAYYLARAGHKVVVIDRQPGPALETSFANGGQISASHTEPWASPSNVPNIIKWLGRDDAPLKFRLKADPALWSWCIRFIANCTKGRADINTERMLRLALYSRDLLADLRHDTGIEYDQLSTGILHIYRDKKALAAARERMILMNDLGLDRTLLDVESCQALEPALKTAAQNGLISGGIFTPGDESGDAHTFTTALAGMAEKMGVQFRYNCRINDLVVKDGRVKAAQTNQGDFDATSCVVALGSYSPLLLKPLGISLPVYPAKGYSVTLDVGDSPDAPFVSLIQDELKLVYSRLGGRLRIAGTAEIAGYDTQVDDQRARQILKAALTLFPDSPRTESGEFWAGLRPKTPDSVPIIGKTTIENLHLNTGHGTLGWTMACGSAKVLADLVSGNEPEISLDGLGINRFGK